jgi:hypothetical protein
MRAAGTAGTLGAKTLGPRGRVRTTMLQFGPLPLVGNATYRAVVFSPSEGFLTRTVDANRSLLFGEGETHGNGGV